MTELLHRDVTEKILASFFEVHRVLGHGFLETVYAHAMELEMRAKGLQVEREVVTEVFYKGQSVGSFRADALVNRCVITEFKATPRLSPADEYQLLNFLRCSEWEVGLLLHFGGRPTFKRLVSSNARLSPNTDEA